MYGLPENFDTSFVLGRTLELICFNENTVYFHFDGGLLFSIESEYAYQSHESGPVDHIHKVPFLTPHIVQLLGVTISNASASPDGTLILTFVNEHRLKFFDTSRQYESYKIDFDGRTIIV
jgi:hypothetical protein